MSEFWKKRRPRLGEDEERALWERVRTMPASVGGRGARARSPWAALWSRPAVRFGAPVLAVALVAIVWVAQRGPEPPRPEALSQAPRPEAMRVAEPPVTMTGPADEPVAPSPPAETEARRARAAGRDEAVAAKEEIQTFAAPPGTPAPAPAPAGTAVGRSAEGTRTLAKTGAPEASSALDAADATAQRVIAPLPPGPHATRVALLRGGEYLRPLCEAVVRPEKPGDFGTVVELPFTRGWVSVQRVGGRWRILEDPLTHQDLQPAPGPLERRAALAVELDRAMRESNSAAAERVQDAAIALARERPADPGARALVEWAAAAITALEAN